MTFLRKLSARNWIVGLGAVLAVAALPASTRADFKVTFGVGFDMVAVVDNGAGDLNSAVGSISISQTINQVSFEIIANSNRTDLSGGLPQIQDSTVHIMNSGQTAQRAQIAMTDTGFTLSGSAGTAATLQSQLGISSLGGVNTRVTGSFNSYVDNSNTEFGMAIGTASQRLLFPLPPEDQLKEKDFLMGDVFSLTNVFNLVLPAQQRNGAAFTGTTLVASAPEPSSALLVGMALPTLAIAGCYFGRQRRRTR